MIGINTPIKRIPPINAFIEILSGIIRVGPDANKYGDPWIISVAFSVSDGKTAVIKALVSDGKLRYSHYKAAYKALKELGLHPVWYRIKN